MRHFEFLSDVDRARLFHLPPQPFTVGDDVNVLAVALGATLYMPATRPTLGADIAKQARRGVVSAVVCLEDSVADADLADAERNAVTGLRGLARTGTDGPLLFVRVRTPEQIPMITEGLGAYLGVLTGFVLPKFTEDSGAAFLDEVADASARAGRTLLAMPVLESAEVIHIETRTETLVGVARLLAKYRRHILAVRLGATDLSSAYALRRGRDLTVYDVRILADVIADIVNIFARADGSGFVVTGPVWEYYSGQERMFKPQLRESPFTEHSERALRAELIAADLDGLIREVVLDRANGLLGKTVIHPSHVAAVHALSVVTHEEYCDAADILGTAAGGTAVGGASASSYRNKMNESKPHASWAHRTMLRARVFGVAGSDVSFVDLLGAWLHQ